MLNLILIGPQGSGKGTQAQNIIDHYKLHHIEAGRLIRDRAEKHDKKAEIIDHLANQKGQLLPDGVVLDMIYDELEETDVDKGYLFDGFPRTTQQYQALKDLLEDQNQSLSAVIYLHISDEESVKRLTNRRICQKCHKGYSLLLEPDRTACDCGGELKKRPDDEPQAIKNRLELFHQTTQPILDLAEKDNLLIKINGEQDIDAIFEEITSHLDQRNKSG